MPNINSLTSSRSVNYALENKLKGRDCLWLVNYALENKLKGRDYQWLWKITKEGSRLI